jgi:ribosomal protein S6
MNIDESVMRSLTIKLEHEPVFKAAVVEEVAEEVAPVETTDAE